MNVRRLQRLRLQAWIRQEGCCYHCGVGVEFEVVTADHLLPVSQGGELTEENIVAACWECNQRRADGRHRFRSRQERQDAHAARPRPKRKLSERSIRAAREFAERHPAQRDYARARRPLTSRPFEVPLMKLMRGGAGWPDGDPRPETPEPTPPDLSPAQAEALERLRAALGVSGRSESPGTSSGRRSRP